MAAKPLLGYFDDKIRAICISGTDGTITPLVGACDGARIRTLINCSTFQMVPCRVGEYAHNYEIWCDEDAVAKNTPENAVATHHLGAQVHGGSLRGTILLVKRGFIE